MAEVLCVYREVKLIKETAAAAKEEPSDAVAIVSYDEKPGIQAIATTAPDLPPKPGKHPTFARDHEYTRRGTVSLLAGIDLLTGRVHALVKLILDNHSAHISKETKAWLASQPAGRFEFVFTPKHGSWLNLVEGFFSKLPAQCCATSASHPSRNSRTASWLPWINSIAIPSFTPGPTSLTMPHDLIRNWKSMN